MNFHTERSEVWRLDFSWSPCESSIYPEFCPRTRLYCHFAERKRERERERRWKKFPWRLSGGTPRDEGKWVARGQRRPSVTFNFSSLLSGTLLHAAKSERGEEGASRVKARGFFED